MPDQLHGYTIEVITPNELIQKQWDTFLAKSNQYTLYLNSWYLNETWQNWQLLVVHKNNVWKAVMPINIKKKWGISYLLQPYFSQFSGIVFGKIDGKNHAILHSQKVFIDCICFYLKKHIAILDINLNPSINYIYPFIWNKISVYSKISYQLKLNIPYEEIYKGFSTSITNHIKKAKKVNNYEIVINDDINPLINLCKKNKIISDIELLQLPQLWKSISKYQDCFCIHIYERESNILYTSSAFVIDQHTQSMIYLQSAINNQIKHKGLNAVLLDTAIQLAYQKQVLTFDFNGSVYENVESYFRGFNGLPFNYYQLNFENIPYWIKSIWMLKKFIQEKIKYLNYKNNQ